MQITSSTIILSELDVAEVKFDGQKERFYSVIAHWRHDDVIFYVFLHITKIPFAKLNGIA